jgi:acyl carrier protein
MSIEGTDIVLDYLRSKQPGVEISPDLDLIENRILDSMHFVEFLYLLEEAIGEEISLDEVSPDNFRTVNAIKARFFDGGGNRS